MRTIKLKSSNNDSFKYAILLSLHYYDISYDPERISKLKKYEDQYTFTSNNPNEFELNNPKISLTIVDENNNIIHHPTNNTSSKVKIVKTNYYRYAGLKPIKNKYIKSNEIIKSFTQEEIKDMIMQKIIY